MLIDGLVAVVETTVVVVVDAEVADNVVDNDDGDVVVAGCLSAVERIGAVEMIRKFAMFGAVFVSLLLQQRRPIAVVATVVAVRADNVDIATFCEWQKLDD